MKLEELCKILSIPNEVVEQIKKFEKKLNINDLQKSIDEMMVPKTWNSALESIKNYLTPDDDGIKILMCQLLCVCKTYDEYRRLGISQEIFVSTMKFFKRFLEDYKTKYGTYCFVWAWWAVRQISMTEFRIGELEYEMRIEDKKPVIDIHIPADTDLTLNKLRESYCDARMFFRKYYPDFAEAEMLCSSWLLSPSLRNLLDDNSRILHFQNSFIISSMDVDSLGFMDWVYGDRNIPIIDLPENTSLQKRLKKHLLGNGKIEWTTGKLINNPFIV